MPISQATISNGFKTIVKITGTFAIAYGQGYFNEKGKARAKKEEKNYFDQAIKKTYTP